MIVLLSPAKTLDFKSSLPPWFSPRGPSLPSWLDRSAHLVESLRHKSEADLAKLFDVSPKLAALNKARFSEWKEGHRPGNEGAESLRPAAFAFAGDVYRGLRAPNFEKDELDWAQSHVRILSGLYGLLRPLDYIRPYRLEMGVRLRVPPLRQEGCSFDDDEEEVAATDPDCPPPVCSIVPFANLYEFWKDEITGELRRLLAAEKTPRPGLVNLASIEYAGAVDFTALERSALSPQIVHPVFEDFSQGTWKIISFFAKKQRGTMTRWIVGNRIETAQDLLRYKEEGYAYDASVSSPQRPVFRRKNPPKAPASRRKDAEEE